MDSKKIIAKLIKIAHNQQKIIEKLAQQNTDIVDLSGGKSPGPATQPPPTAAQPNQTHTDPSVSVATAILQNPALSKAVVIDHVSKKPVVSFNGGVFNVKMKPGQINQNNQNSLEQIIFPLAQTIPNVRGKVQVKMV